MWCNIWIFNSRLIFYAAKSHFKHFIREDVVNAVFSKPSYDVCLANFCNALLSLNCNLRFFVLPTLLCFKIIISSLQIIKNRFVDFRSFWGAYWLNKIEILLVVAKLYAIRKLTIVSILSICVNNSTVECYHSRQN